MKNSIRNIALTATLAITALTSTGFAIAAQEGNQRNGGGDRQQMQRQNPMEKILAQLDLSSNQTDQIAEIFENNQPQGRQSQEQMETIKQLIEEVLTSEQQATFNTLMESMESNRGNGQRPKR